MTNYPGRQTGRQTEGGVAVFNAVLSCSKIAFIHLTNYLETGLNYLRCNNFVCVCVHVCDYVPIQELNHDDIMKLMTDSSSV